MLKGNKGEWSEIYTLFKLLGEGEFYLGNKDIQRIEEFVYPIISILRPEESAVFEYSIQDEIVILSNNIELLRLPIETFKTKALLLLESIKNNRERTFSVPEIEEFMNTIHCFSLKANASTKIDISIIVHDPKSKNELIGFSIKSQLGSPSTLLNAGKTTNFIFKIDNLQLTEDEINEINLINSKSKIMDRIEVIKAKGGVFCFEKLEKAIFANNLMLIDSRLPEILAEIIFNFYSSKTSLLSELVTVVSDLNIFQFDTSSNHPFYEYKIKRFLTDVALGMMPSVVWSGKYEATGGYLIVKEDGEILCYHIYNRNELEDYLFHNTKLETASSSRHGFGSIYRKGEGLYFKLNLQIRFIK